MVMTTDGFYYPTITRIMDSFLAHHQIPHFISKKHENDLKIPDYAEMLHGNLILTLQRCQGWTCGNVQLFVFYLSHQLVQVCEIELSHIGKTTEIPI